MTFKDYATFRRPHLFFLWAEFVAECVKQGQAPQLDLWLKKQFSKNRQWGKNDRAWYRDQIFQAMRRAWLNTLAYLYTQDDQIKIESPQQLFEAWQTLPPENIFNTDEEHVLNIQQFLQQLPSLENKLNLAGIPVWFQDVVQKRQVTSGWDELVLQTFLTGQNIRPPLWLRPPYVHFDPVQAENAICPDGFEPQDWASQKVGFSVSLSPHDLVWDCCAGGGGKTLLLAQRLIPSGRVYASDVRSHLFEEIQRRSEKNQLKNISFFPWSTLDGFPTVPEEVRQHGGFDVVFVDAPCSGSGTWRRNPDGRFRSPHPQSSAGKSLLQLQRDLLHFTSYALRPGGILVYVTCSWFVEENEEILDYFLDLHQGSFELLGQEFIGFPQENSDTMFVGRLRKNF